MKPSAAIRISQFRPGYTLIEMVCVMAVIAAMAVLAMPPVFSLMTAHGLSTGVRDVSNHLVNARAEAIARHTLTRFVVARSWKEENGSFRKYSTWHWNAESGEFDRASRWYSLPEGVVFEPRLPTYINRSEYALNDATSVIGEDAMGKEDAAREAMAFEGKPVEVQIVEFLPTGAARIPGGTLNKVIYVLVEGDIKEGTNGSLIVRHCEDGKNPDNWAQVNLGTLTGRVQIYRP